MDTGLQSILVACCAMCCSTIVSFADIHCDCDYTHGLSWLAKWLQKENGLLPQQTIACPSSVVLHSLIVSRLMTKPSHLPQGSIDVIIGYMNNNITSNAAWQNTRRDKHKSPCRQRRSRARYLGLTETVMWKKIFTSFVPSYLILWRFGVAVEFNDSPDTIFVISEAVFTANHHHHIYSPIIHHHNNITQKNIQSEGCQRSLTAH